MGHACRAPSARVGLGGRVRCVCAMVAGSGLTFRVKVCGKMGGILL
jgi:hypothetical protein